jgi:hypothetical protein
MFIRASQTTTYMELFRARNKTANWMDAQRHGYGAFYGADGTRYEGEWINGRKDGKGTFTYPNAVRAPRFRCLPSRYSHLAPEQDVYVGLFKDGLPSGPGLLTFNRDSMWSNPDL